MKAKKLVMISLFVFSMGLLGGCHYGSDDDHSGWGYGRATSNREAFRAGRAYERRQAWSYGRPYYDRYGYYRR